MQHIAPEIASVFGNKVRVRVCGILIENDKILLVNHQGLTSSNQFWSPPGGGIEFGESAVQCLVREFTEETDLIIEVVKFLFVNEFISTTLHAIELFFEVKAIGGTLKKGTDPELTSQIIKQVQFMPMEEVLELVTGEVHSIFGRCKNLQDILLLNSHFVSL